MQMQLPIFPSNTKMISETWSVFEKNDFVYYLHNRSPVHIHAKNDLNTYRYVTGSSIVNTDCTASGFSKVFGIGVRNFERYEVDVALKGYYDLDTVILSLAFLYLCCRKNPELREVRSSDPTLVGCFEPA